MVHVTTLFTEAELQDALDRGLVTKRKHPALDLWIYNYTATTQFAWEWTPVTLNCRGLVLDKDLNIVARSLPKFFSYEQLNGKLPEGEFVVEEKLDGSMLLAFNYNGELVTATRGSFESEQAIDAKRFFPKALLPSYGDTWIFEYIARQNKIVVAYDYEGLVLLDIVREDGTRVNVTYPDLLDLLATMYGFKRPKIYSFNSLEEILKHKEDNLEGFVLRYEDGYLCKIKLEEYKRLHKLITGFNEKNVWEALKQGSLEKVIEEAPDEMHDWIRKVQKELEDKYNEIMNDAEENFVDKGDRKENALHYKTCKYPSVMFHLLDGKDASEMVWDMVKPKVTQTFKVVNEESN